MIIGDWNEVNIRGSASYKLCTEFNLVDVWSQQHPGKEFATYQRGSRRIDFCLATSSLANLCDNMIYEPLHYRLSGDRRGFYLDFPQAKFFTQTLTPTAPISQRRLKSKDRKSVGRYILAVHDYLVQHSVFQRMEKALSASPPDHSLVEKIDLDITRACKHGENSCKARRPDYWYIQIHLLHLHYSVLNQVCRRKQKGHSTISLISRAAEYGIEINKDATLQELTSLRHSIRLKIRSERKQGFEKRQAFLTAQANLKEDVSDAQAAKAIRQLRNSERRTRVYRYFKALFPFDPNFQSNRMSK